MAGQDNNPGSVISLPKGGGAMKGIGEKFSPDLFTGTGNFTIPIAIPPGRNGFQPELNLTYSTGQGNGSFGMGWRLSIPGISRKTAKGIPKYDDGKDVFILSGAEDLVPVPGGPAGAQRYQPRTEGLFAKIDHYKDATNNYWRIRSKDGLESFYGTPGLAGKDPAVVANPADLTKVFEWKLTQTRDPFGNSIVYSYKQDLNVEDSRQWNQLNIQRIQYVNAYVNNSEQFRLSVDFLYEVRPDPFSEYRSGFEIRTCFRCTTIETRTNFDQERLVRQYQIIYLDKRTDLEDLDNLLPLNRASLMSRFKVIGIDGDKTEELPPVEFAYSRFNPEKRNFFPITGADLPARSLAGYDTEMVDLFGSGLPDLIQMNGTTRYWRNLGKGQFDLPRFMKDAPSGLSLSNPAVQLLDADGDGRTDLLITSNELSGYFPLRFGGLWDHKSFQKYSVVPSFNLKDPEVKLVDLTGDGVTDAIRSGSQMECYFNDSKKGWSKESARFVPRKALTDFPNVSFSDSQVKWGDMTGDGMQDILLVHDGNVEYWPNLGYGNWAKRITMRNCPRFPYGYNVQRILIGDVDGDGLADIVYVDDRSVTLWINQSGNRWSDPIIIKGTPPVADRDAIRLADVLGSGVSGVLWSREASYSSKEAMWFLDFTGGQKPYLLCEMNNNMGAVTKVAYTSSTEYYLKDQEQPQTRWKTPLPFPVLVVSKVEVIDQISGGKLTTEYDYHHGYWDGAEREFRGFGRVDQRDTEAFETYHQEGLRGSKKFQSINHKTFSPPLETRTWFHQGPIGDEFGDWDESDYEPEFWQDDPSRLQRPEMATTLLKQLERRSRRNALRTLRGSVLRTEVYAIDGSPLQDRPYTVTEAVFGLREEMPPASNESERLHIFFPYGVAQRTTQWERGNDPLTQINFTDDHDVYGQPHTQISIAIPRGRNPWQLASDAEPYLVTQSVTSYCVKDDEERYMTNRVAHTTNFEIINDGRDAVFDLHTRILEDTVSKSIIGQSLHYYDGQAFEGLQLGQLGKFGALVRTESLILTEEILQEVWKGEDVTQSMQIPSYLLANQPVSWTTEYPDEFKNTLPPLAGYTFKEAGPVNTKGYFATTGRTQYDFQTGLGEGFGMPLQLKDPLGKSTAISNDKYNFLPERVRDAAGMEVSAQYNYSSLQPTEITDPNGNRTAYAFTPLGLLYKTAVMGKIGETMGDTLEVPGIQMDYDFWAYYQNQQAVFVRTVSRVHHVHDLDIPLPQRDEIIEMREYSDGFGRLLQSRTQAEDVIFGEDNFGTGVLSPNQDALKQPAIGHGLDQSLKRVVVSGWQRYDNKGRVVEKYEPFFSVGWEYMPPTETQMGQKAVMIYDPRGQVIRTLNPDGSEQCVIYGVPVDDPDNPKIFFPTPWEAYTYDANDNAGRTHQKQSRGYAHHWNTPASILIDALGRTVKSIARSRASAETGQPLPAVEEYVTESRYDIGGNVLTITDPLGRIAFRHVYDLANRVLRIFSIDAGLRQSVLDVLGNPAEGRDSKGALVLHAYDLLNRPVRLWAKDSKEQVMTLRERIVYGDSVEISLTEEQRKKSNLLGKLYQHYDEAGLLITEVYDFKGLLLEKVRQVVSDQMLLSVFNTAPNGSKIEAFRINWQPPDDQGLDEYASQLLDITQYITTIAYDGLNRTMLMRYPEDIEGGRKELLPHYNRAGDLEKVTLDEQPYVNHIAYNAKGQRTLIAYGNKVMTRYAYDAHTFKLVRLRSERYSQPGELNFKPENSPLQDFAYTYDLAGNILSIHDQTPGCGIPNTLLGQDVLHREFSYDPLYRLLSATGRECDQSPPSPPWLDDPRCTDATKTRSYTESYQYDKANNIAQLRHVNQSGGFTRNLSLLPGNNRLSKLTVGDNSFIYSYDENGNIIQEGFARHFDWNYADQLKSFRTQTEGAKASLHAQYLYDATGQRVKKLVRKQGGQVEATVYIDGAFEYQSTTKPTGKEENNTLHVMDDQSRIALVRVGKAFSDDVTPAIKYQLTDHLGSSSLVIDLNGGWINGEEYTSYGETSFGAYSKKRYRFTGKEKDEESGLYYYGARYYASWIIRWVSCDPAGIVDGTNIYSYVNSNPIRFIDLVGTETEVPTDQEVAALVSDVTLHTTSSSASPMNKTELKEANLFESETIKQPNNTWFDNLSLENQEILEILGAPKENPQAAFDYVQSLIDKKINTDTICLKDPETHFWNTRIKPPTSEKFLIQGYELDRRSDSLPNITGLYGFGGLEKEISVDAGLEVGVHAEAVYLLGYDFEEKKNWSGDLVAWGAHAGPFSVTTGYEYMQYTDGKSTVHPIILKDIGTHTFGFGVASGPDPSTQANYFSVKAGIFVVGLGLDFKKEQKNGVY